MSVNTDAIRNFVFINQQQCNVAQIKENKATRKYFRKIKPNQRTAVGDTDTHGEK